MGYLQNKLLINHYDKKAIANASSTASKTSFDFLPILGAGEAIMGFDFPMPVILKIHKPEIPPDSDTPGFIKTKGAIAPA
jgi:uncharacterized protein